jgi:hypothetical protein
LEVAVKTEAANPGMRMMGRQVGEQDGEEDGGEAKEDDRRERSRREMQVNRGI